MSLFRIVRYMFVFPFFFVRLEVKGFLFIDAELFRNILPTFYYVKTHYRFTNKTCRLPPQTPRWTPVLTCCSPSPLPHLARRQLLPAHGHRLGEGVRREEGGVTREIWNGRKMKDEEEKHFCESEMSRREKKNKSEWKRIWSWEVCLSLSLSLSFILDLE